MKIYDDSPQLSARERALRTRAIEAQARGDATMQISPTTLLILLDTIAENVTHVTS